jgi:hypothetical protein
MQIITLIKFHIDEHIQLNRAIDECRREYEILIDAVIDSQRGVIQPQLITTAQILEQVNLSQADMPDDLSLPIHTSALYEYLLLKIVNFDVYLKGKFLVCVIRLPLTSNVVFNLYHVLPFPIRIKGTESKFIFIQPENEYLLMDTAKRYFTDLKVDEVHECKIVNKELRVCKQRQPLQLAHLDEIFEAQMIEPIRTIPASCSQRIVDLNHTLWKQINGNELLFVAPVPDVLTCYVQNTNSWM